MSAPPVRNCNERKTWGHRKARRLESGHFMILSVVVCVRRNRTGGHRKVCRWGNSPLYAAACINKHIEKPNHKVELSFKKENKYILAKDSSTL
jgi:hypothetical protein